MTKQSTIQAVMATSYPLTSRMGDSPPFPTHQDAVPFQFNWRHPQRHHFHFTSAPQSSPPPSLKSDSGIIPFPRFGSPDEDCGCGAEDTKSAREGRGGRDLAVQQYSSPVDPTTAAEKERETGGNGDVMNRRYWGDDVAGEERKEVEDVVEDGVGAGEERDGDGEEQYVGDRSFSVSSDLEEADHVAFRSALSGSLEKVSSGDCGGEEMQIIKRNDDKVHADKVACGEQEKSQVLEDELAKMRCLMDGLMAESEELMRLCELILEDSGEAQTSPEDGQTRTIEKLLLARLKRVEEREDEMAAEAKGLDEKKADLVQREQRVERGEIELGKRICWLEFKEAELAMKQDAMAIRESDVANKERDVAMGERELMTKERLRAGGQEAVDQGKGPCCKKVVMV
ncbi:hypothetical protein KVT40_007318 [Elsinoe batatas]|uniref:Uncharacterized protein n=1 Tax=Elsinoe batatas TaxID=2601811 RepID=A0A8K0KUI2_9PEZI|nr:hypothetical protein KVT40_007318 [Elsinoe batatas]